MSDQVTCTFNCNFSSICKSKDEIFNAKRSVCIPVFFSASLYTDEWNSQRIKSANRQSFQASDTWSTPNRSQDQLTSQQQLTRSYQQLIGQRKQLTGSELQLIGQGSKPTGSDHQLIGGRKQLTGSDKELISRRKQQLRGSTPQLTDHSSFGQLSWSTQQLNGPEKQLPWSRKQLTGSDIKPMGGAEMLPMLLPKFTTAFQPNGSLETEIL